MRQIIYFLLGFFVIFTAGLSFATETICQGYLKSCEEKCINQGGVWYYYCWGDQIWTDKKPKCACINNE